jgi:ribosome biogenesis GTPase
MGVEVLEFSLKADPQTAAARLAPRLAGRVTLLLGPSGMGKSTLINLLVPAAQAQVGEISRALNAGRHTTTTTRWYWLDSEPARERRGALIDSPGFQEFGLRQVEPAQLATLMPDLTAAAGHCRFYNCSHRHEPGCGVRTAFERGEISASRWRIYGELYDELAAAPRR